MTIYDLQSQRIILLCDVNGNCGTFTEKPHRAMHVHHSPHPKQQNLQAHRTLRGLIKGFFTTVLITLLGLLFSIQSAVASSPVLALDSSADQEISLTPYLEVLEDPSTTLSLEDVRSSSHAPRFKAQASTAEALSFGFTRSAYWFRLTLYNSTDQTQTRILEIANYALSRVDFYARFNSADTYQVTRTGAAMPFSSRAIKNRYFAFPVSVPAQSQHVVYMRVQALDGLLVPAKLWSESGFQQFKQQDYMRQSLYYGMVLAMVLFNLLLFIGLRDSMFLLYAFFEIVFALALASFGGLAHEFLWPESSNWSNIAHFVGWSGSLVVGTLFFKGMMQICIQNTLWNKLFIALISFYLLAMAGMVIAKETFLFLSVAMNGVGAIIIFSSFIFGMLANNRPAYFLFTAFTALGIGILMTVGRGLGVLPTNFLTINGMQIGSALEMITLALALADRFNQIRKEKAADQQKLLEAQESLVLSLRDSEQLLNEKVDLRTAELKAANIQTTMTLRLAESAKERAVAAQRQAEQDRKEAELARERTAQALSDLQESQTKLLAAEKMASLGLLVSNVAHEINTPNSAVQSSSVTVADSMRATLQNMPRLLESVNAENRMLFLQLISHFDENNEPLTTREERQVTKQVNSFLDNAGIEDAIRKARLMVKLRAHAQISDYLQLLKSEDVDFILSAASNVVDVLNGTSNIQTASAKISRIVGSLKELSGSDRTVSMFENYLYQCMEKTINALESKFLDIEVVRNYQDMAPLHCDHESMQQLFSHLLVNAAQAMQHRGTIMIGMRTVNNHAEVRITDFGCGIADEIKDRIFEPFFTTRTSGEGGGMGLALVKKVLDQHKGRIDVQTEVGNGTTIILTLPYSTDANE